MLGNPPPLYCGWFLPSILMANTLCPSPKAKMSNISVVMTLVIKKYIGTLKVAIAHILKMQLM